MVDRVAVSVVAVSSASLNETMADREEKARAGELLWMWYYTRALSIILLMN